jgi:hypothetical protein
VINNATGSGTGTNSVTVNSTGTLGGTGFIHGPVVVNSGGALAPGNAGMGTLTLRSNLTLNAGSALRFELGTPASSDRIAVTRNLQLGGTLHLTNLAAFGPGTYTLMTYGGTLSGTLVIGTTPAGYEFVLNTSTAGQVRLIVSANPQPAFTSWVTAGSDLLLSGNGGMAGATYYLLSATNLTAPVMEWQRVSTNVFGFEGNFTLTNAIDPFAPQRFFRLGL